MEVDEVDADAEIPVPEVGRNVPDGGGSDNDKLYVFLSGDKDGQIHTFEHLSLSTMTLAEFRRRVNRDIKDDFAFEVMYNGVILRDEDKTLSSFSIKPKNVIHILPRRVESNPSSPSKRKVYTETQLINLSLALRTAFLSTAFARTVESLGNPETLEALFAIAPQLRTDTIGIAIIQSAHMILLFSEPEALTQLASTRPWVLDALNFIAATVHGEKKTVGGPLPRGLLAAQLLNPAMMGDDEEEMEEAQGQGQRPAQAQGRGGSRASRATNRPQGQNPAHAPITRDMLAQALTGLTAPLGESIGSGLGQYLRPQTAPTTATSPSIATSTPATPANNVSSLLGIPGNESPGAITADMVRRLMLEALNQLPADQRAERMNMITQMARQMVGEGGSGQPAPPSEPIQTAPPSAQPSSGGNSEALNQLRELGIHDERLSLLALRVSGGDVGTAAELIFSGWQGEGAENEGMEEGDDSRTD